MKELLAELWVTNRAALRQYHVSALHDTHHVLRELNGRIGLINFSFWNVQQPEGRTATEAEEQQYSMMSMLMLLYIYWIFVQNVYRACPYGEINLMKNMIYSVECVSALIFSFCLFKLSPGGRNKRVQHTRTRIGRSIKTADRWSQSHTCGRFSADPCFPRGCS